MNKRTATPDRRPLYGYAGTRRNRGLFWWLARRATRNASPFRGNVDAATGKIVMYRGWKGERHAK